MTEYDPIDYLERRRKRHQDDGPGLFDAPPPAQMHSETSLAAALRIAPKTGTMRRRVLDHLRQCGAHGATDEELQLALNMNPSTQRPRRVELVRAGLVHKTGMRRSTSSGGTAAVYVAVAMEVPA